MGPGKDERRLATPFAQAGLQPLVRDLDKAAVGRNNARLEEFRDCLDDGSVGLSNSSRLRLRCAAPSSASISCGANGVRSLSIHASLPISL